MNKKILDTEIQAFIKEHINADIQALLLKKGFFEDVSNAELVQQIVSRKKCQTKLPTWFSANGIFFPPKLNLEQTSSEITAQFKSNLVKGDNLIDLTGGFGVDCYYFSKIFKEIIHCELNQELSEIVEHNTQVLGVSNMECLCGDGLEILQNLKKSFDCLYIDPSRRNDKKGKVFLLSDCLPNVPDHLDELFNFTNTILIKVSPLLDITNGIKELHSVKEVIVVAVKNEVKELLFLLNKNYSGPISIRSVNIVGETAQEFEFTYNQSSVPNIGVPKKFLYEPNAAILKSGGFNEVSEQFGLSKLHQHSHLYTNENSINFPGRRFSIKEVIPYNKKAIKKLFGKTKANITTRNFPKSVEVLRKELGIKDGGDTYLFFTTNSDNEKVMLVCTKH